MADLNELENKVQRLVTKYHELEVSHQGLQQQLDLLQQACKQLQVKRDKAITHVEQVIERLKTLEKQS